MDPERWRRVKEICGLALERPEDERGAFLATACAGDAALRSEVDSLLAGASRIEGFLDSPAVGHPAVASVGERPPSDPGLVGQTILHYAIAEKIGEGGMGVVYRAEDVRLGRAVALKFLPEALSRDKVALERFRREARAASRLNHPRICTLHDIVEHDGRTFLVMEFLAGETLAAALARGPLPLENALELGAEIADALAAAHAEGIVHRDLKPGNVMLTKTGAKLLDFGLAKLVGANRLAAGMSSVESLSAAEWGVAAGTVPYMAPEQLEGRPVDARTDIWALGAMLYEMVAGRRAFDAPSQAGVIAGILDRQPSPLAEVEPLTPPLLGHVVHKCLAKDQDERWNSASDVAHLLRLARNPAAAVPAARAGGSRVKRWALPLGVATALVALTAVVTLLPKRTAERTLERRPEPSRALNIELPHDLPLAPGGLMHQAHDRPTLALSADGSRLAYVALAGDHMQICLRDMRTREVTPLRGTEGGHSPFFSPNGARVAFFADGKLKWASVAGATVQELADAPNPYGGTWGADGWIYFTRQSQEGVHRVRPEGGPIEPVVPVLFRMPERPGGRCLIGTAGEAIVCRDEATRTIAPLVNGFGARYASSGHLVYSLPGKMIAVPYDRDRGTVTGPPVTLFEDLRTAPFGVAQFALGQDGTLVYAPGPPQTLTRFVWVDRKGVAIPVPGIPERKYSTFDLSLDGSRIAYGLESDDGRVSGVGVYDLRRGQPVPLTTRAATGAAPWVSYPRWAPDGTHVVCFRKEKAEFQVVMYSLEDGAEPQVMWRSGAGGPVYLTPMNAAPGGSQWFTFGVTRDRGFDIVRLRAPAAAGGTWTAEPLLSTEFGEYFPQLSPDGRWLLFTSDRTGRDEIYVTSYPVPGRLHQVSQNGGHKPAWMPGGREIVYRNGTRMFLVPVKTGAVFEKGDARALFEGAYPNIPGFDFAISPDGQRFLMLENRRFVAPTTTLTVVTNFFEELRRRVPKEQK